MILQPSIKKVDNILGKAKGVVGKDNSCYMDASLFCLFAFNECLDELLKTESENATKKHLLKNIINPLRRFLCL